jgi:hypothetical protein
MILGFQTDSETDAGHAVAVNQRVNGFVLFDPNLGVYLFRFEQNLTKALSYLFQGIDGEEPAYTGTGAVSYLLLGTVA